MRVPASTSNLGPGFDCLGLALRLYNEVTVARGRGDSLPEIAAEAGELFFARTKTKPFRLSSKIEGDVPLSRGLGSSATVRVGVIIALSALTGAQLSRDAMFQLCSELEGHPDNVAPAMFGGFSVISAEGVRHRFQVSPQLKIVLLIPELHVATHEARRVLPAQIPLRHAVENTANAAAIVAAFATRRYKDLHSCFTDDLHQPYRTKLVPFLDDVVAAATKAGAVGAFLSGSGSAICSLTLHNPDKVGRAMRRAGPNNARTIITRADNRGARLI